MIKDVYAFTLQSNTACMQWQQITTNICFSCQLVAFLTLSLHEFALSQAKTNTNITSKHSIFYQVRGREEQETVLQVICFLQLSVNQWVSGSLNCRFLLHYYDCPKRESEGLPVFSLAGIHTHTHTHRNAHIPGSPIPLRASHCLHGQSTSSNQLKTALSSWSMAEVGVGQDEGSRRGGEVFRKIHSMTQWEFLFGAPIWSSSP